VTRTPLLKPPFGTSVVGGIRRKGYISLATLLLIIFSPIESVVILCQIKSPSYLFPIEPRYCMLIMRFPADK
jgi:hypothetical protein